MKTVEINSTRLIAQGPEEKAVVKSWGSWWSRFGTLERKGKPIYLLFGDWSGYTSSQYRVTHVDYAGYYGVVGQKLGDDYRGTVQFSDGTTMQVWVRAVSRAEILERKYSKREGYNSLINKLIKSGKTYYKVGDEL